MNKPGHKSNLDRTQQTVALADPSARMLVVAGPGTGKTEVAAARLVHLLEAGVSPAAVVVLSFSRSAARNLALRIEGYGGLSSTIAEELRHVSIRTFDSWTFRILRLLGSPPGLLLSRSYEQNIEALVDAMKVEQREQVHALLPDLKHLVIDELQDLGGVRGALVLELLGLFCKGRGAKAGFTLLGDEAQGIYGFTVRAGADAYTEITARTLFKRIRSTFRDSLTEVSLGKNYRAQPKLASLAGSLRNILVREGITASEKLDAMQKILARVPACESPTDGADAVGSAAILTRTNGEAIRVAQSIWGTGNDAPTIAIDLRTASQPVRAPVWVGATLGQMQSLSVGRDQFCRIYRHLYGAGDNALAGAVGIPDEEVAWSRLCRASGAGASSASVDITQLRARLQWPDSFPDEDGARAGGLHIMTVHQSKGLEFGSVTVLRPAAELDAGDADGAASEGGASAEDETVEKASVIFVAITRAAMTVRRMEAPTGFGPLSPYRFPSGRTRWRCWRNGWVNLEVGIGGDVSPQSFVDSDVHGSDESVMELQDLLARQAHVLRGRKVMLVKRASNDNPKHYVYGIHLQEGREPGQLLGTAADQLTYDLLHLLHPKGISLPRSILNLRISDVVTLSDPEPPASTAGRFARSGIWLGVQLYGTGDFKVYKRNS